MMSYKVITTDIYTHIANYSGEIAGSYCQSWGNLVTL